MMSLPPPPNAMNRRCLIWVAFRLMATGCLAWSPLPSPSPRPPNGLMSAAQFPSLECFGDDSPHPGRVKDADRWVHLSSESLKNFTGKSLLERLDVPSVSHVHNHERFAVLSHGAQDDPVYNYFNRAALLTFRYPETAAYRTPSRYSAPDGDERDVKRAREVREALRQDVTEIPDAVRQAHGRDLIRIRGIVLWNVYDESGARVGQTAVFDRARVEPAAPRPGA